MKLLLLRILNPAEEGLLLNLFFISFSQDSSSISSADLFGHSSDRGAIDITASDLINRLSFQVHILLCVFYSVLFMWKFRKFDIFVQAQQDISSLKNIAGETGKKLGSIASSLMSDLQDRIL